MNFTPASLDETSNTLPPGAIVEVMADGDEVGPILPGISYPFPLVSLRNSVFATQEYEAW